MPMFQNRATPNMPQAPAEYDQLFFNALINTIRLYFNDMNNVQQLNLARLNLNLDSLPTEADFNTLRLGDVFRDTTDTSMPGSQQLRIKTATNTVYLSGVSGKGAVGTVTP